MGPDEGDDSDRATAGAAAGVTRLLERAGGGDAGAAAQLLPLVYAQLRDLAARHMRHERPDQTLQATALVHEAYLRLAGGGRRQQQWDGRWHFFAAAAEAMRRILVENARARGRLKRGGALRRVSLEGAEPGAALTVDDPPDELLQLDEALDELARRHPDKAKLVTLRYFAGLTIEQAAQAMGVSVPTVNRHWAFARAWLYHHISAAGGGGGG